MNRRLVLTIVAVIAAALAAVLVILYVNNSDSRAVAQLEPRRVLVAVEPIPEGTPATAIAELVEQKELPGSAVVPGALPALTGLEETVVAADIQPGEQLLAAKFVEPAQMRAGDVPEGLHQVSIQLPPNRVIGGNIQRGDRVGVFVSTAAASGPDQAAGQRTRLMLHSTLVSDVYGQIRETTNEDGEAARTAPSDNVMVTLAVEPRYVEELVFAAEYTSIWLSREDAGTPTDGMGTVTMEDIY